MAAGRDMILSGSGAEHPELICGGTLTAVKCPGCGDRVAVQCGNLAGGGFEGACDEALRQARDACPSHAEPVRI